MLNLRRSTVGNRVSLFICFFYELNRIYFVGFLRENKNIDIFKMLFLMLILK
jgi:hypothetical protein